MHFDQEKLSHVVHYICYQCRDDPSKLGATKLNKVLWFAEMFSYKHSGVPITGEAYMKMQFGPVSMHLPQVLSNLESSGLLTIDKSEEDFETTLYYARKGPKEDVLSVREMNIINSQIEHICDEHTATSASEKSHDEMWRIAQMHEILPYAAAVVSFAPVTDDLYEWARQESAAIQ